MKRMQYKYRFAVTQNKISKSKTILNNLAKINKRKQIILFISPLMRAKMQ